MGGDVTGPVSNVEIAMEELLSMKLGTDVVWIYVDSASLELVEGLYAPVDESNLGITYASYIAQPEKEFIGPDSVKELWDINSVDYPGFLLDTGNVEVYRRNKLAEELNQKEVKEELFNAILALVE